mgnify:CR=1 FL=1
MLIKLPRNNYYEIGQELIASNFDYFAGGGLKKNNWFRGRPDRFI